MVNAVFNYECVFVCVWFLEIVADMYVAGRVLSMNLKLGKEAIVSLESVLKNLLFALNTESSIVKWSRQLCLFHSNNKQKQKSVSQYFCQDHLI